MTDSIESKKDAEVTQPSILSYANDLANQCSLAGLLSSVLAIYFAIVGNFPAAMIGLAWAVFFDWTDGNIARQWFYSALVILAPGFCRVLLL